MCIGPDKNGLFEVAVASFDGLQDLHSSIHDISEQKSETELLLWVEHRAACDDTLEPQHSTGPHDDRVRFERAILAKEFLRIYSEDGLPSAVGWSRASSARGVLIFRDSDQQLTATITCRKLSKLQNDRGLVCSNPVQ